MFAADRASRDFMQMELVSCEPGRAVMRMTVREAMLNGHDICHGGLIFTLADSTFAFACNSHNKVTVAAGCSIEFLKPGRLGDVLTCEGVEQVLQGRHGIYDMKVSNQRGEVVAMFRGKSTQIQGTVIPEERAMNSFPLEPIEKAGIDELRALQLKRLKATLQHAYANSPVYRAKFDAAGVHPDDCRIAGRPGEVSLHHQAGPARQLPLRHVRRAARAVRAHPRFQRHHRQTHGGGLHAATTSTPGRT